VPVLRANNVGDFTGVTNPITLANPTTQTATWSSVPANMPAVANPWILKLSIEPNTPEEEIIYVTLYVPGTTTALVVRAAEGPGLAIAHNAKAWAHAPTAMDFGDVYTSNGVAPPPDTTDLWVDTSGTLPGPQGPQGSQGPQGRQGFQGPTGPTGPQGTQGLFGSQGTQGVQGPQGNLGNQGTQGTQGSQGNQGHQGNQGGQGPQGYQGVAGSGAQGAQGPQGEMGPQGFQGYQGGSGNQGTQGVQGAATGGMYAQVASTPPNASAPAIAPPMGFLWLDTSTSYAGVPGPQGVQGVQGVQGNQGFMGPQGYQGPQGFQGSGIVGPQGPQGTTGIPVAGTQGQALVKNSGANYDTLWSSEIEVHTATAAPRPRNVIALWVDTGTPAPVAPIIPGQVIGATQYSPTSLAQYPAPLNTPAAMDGTNLTVSFVCPPSGQVYACASAAANVTPPATVGAASAIGFCYVTHGTTTVMSQIRRYLQLASGVAVAGPYIVNTCTYEVLVTGLTPGQTYQWDLACYYTTTVTGQGSATVYSQLSSAAAGYVDVGPALLTIKAA